jgi:hypothetical protein
LLFKLPSYIFDKFKTAIENLPYECKILFSPWESKDWHSKDIWNSKDVITDFEARMSVFYCDIADSADAVKPLPHVDKAILEKAVEKFRTIVDEINI